VSKKFNPFYDSEFLISTNESPEKRYLVELYEDELIQLKFEIESILRQINTVKKSKSKQTKTKINAHIKTDYTTRRCVALIPTLEPHKYTEKWTCMNCNAELSKSDTRCPVCGYKFID